MRIDLADMILIETGIEIIVNSCVIASPQMTLVGISLVYITTSRRHYPQRVDVILFFFSFEKLIGYIDY